MPDSTMTFEAAFHALTSKAPFPWQTALYKRLITGDIPKSCNLPTGLGKTSVLAIWLLAWKAMPALLPRRLVYVVNRRTVVDQTTTEAENLRKNAPHLGIPNLAISTLRGQFVDNREWSADPSRPAIICGTVDMIGSRLLFSGYGVGFKGKPLHAGFLGQDVLLVHDEAHLEPAFQNLLTAIEKEQTRCNEFGKFRVMELSATSRGDGEPFSLTPLDFEDDTVKKRIGAKKAIVFHPQKDPKKLADQIADLALAHKDSKRAILVFVRTVDDVMKVRDRLGKQKCQTITLTGTMRGKERDELVNNDTFKRYLPGANDTNQTVYLICTSAGEVGVNISADHLVCDLSTFESMAQRFGRVNRFGERTDTRIDIVHSTTFEDDAYDMARCKTLDLLKKLNGDGSPAALGRLDAAERAAAFAPAPTILPTSDILFDAWALTTIKDKLPGRPPVEPYLHGLPTDWQPPETHVAWREEVDVIKGELLDDYRPADLLEDFPFKPHELLRDSSARVFDLLKKLPANPETPAWILADGGSVNVTTLGKIQAGDKEYLYYVTVLLPPEAGGLSKQGMLDSTAKERVADVSAEWYADKEHTLKHRVRIWGDDVEIPKGMRRSRPVIDTNPEEGDADEPSQKRYWHWFERIGSAGEGMATANKPYDLQKHLNDAEKAATDFLDGLSLAEPLRTAVIVAAMYHDLGKARTTWQRSIGNFDPKTLYAKSGGSMRPRDLNGYRHEFGSLLDVTAHQRFRDLPDDMNELVLHLIAAHHGRARPHFPADEAFDPEPKGRNVDALASEIPRRFAKLQRKYGRWGLAYLESLVRAADILASQKAEKGDNQ
ncbi:MAG: type I-U CRISPR-associated helicase/endonuclease Cas3 [Gemmataceae bacterium]|nr:type I-U CRISPR-associated helicase/endonuclease Cas3 [Gemmataceae bacterium]